MLEAERTRTPILPLSDSHPDLTEQDSYQIQDALVATKEKSQVDYKLGFTSDAMREQMGIPDPNYGQLTWSMWVDAGPIKLSELIHPRVEPEVALLVERDLSGPGLTPAQVYPAIPLGLRGFGGRGFSLPRLPLPRRGQHRGQQLDRPLCAGFSDLPDNRAGAGERSALAGRRDRRLRGGSQRHGRPRPRRRLVGEPSRGSG